MLFPLIIGAALGAVTVVFALQNLDVITVTFFTWQIAGSLALILMTAVAMGFIIALLFVLPESIRNYFKYKQLKKENANLAEELRKQKELTVFAKKDSYTPTSEGETLVEAELVN
jgi:uncharacterized integral membrane protein